MFKYTKRVDHASHYSRALRLLLEGYGYNPIRQCVDVCTVNIHMLRYSASNSIARLLHLSGNKAPHTTRDIIEATHAMGWRCYPHTGKGGFG